MLRVRITSFLQFSNSVSLSSGHISTFPQVTLSSIITISYHQIETSAERERLVSSFLLKTSLTVSMKGTSLTKSLHFDHRPTLIYIAFSVPLLMPQATKPRTWFYILDTRSCLCKSQNPYSAEGFCSSSYLWNPGVQLGDRDTEFVKERVFLYLEIG